MKLQRERWGSLLVQEKYREEMPVTRDIRVIIIIIIIIIIINVKQEQEEQKERRMQ